MMRIAIFATLGLLPMTLQGQTIASARPTIPRVIGMTAAAAIDALAITRLQIVQRDSVTSSVPAGHVVDQRPRAGTAVSATRAETLFVATPQKPKRGANCWWCALVAPVIEELIDKSKPPVAPPEIGRASCRERG